MMPEVWDGGAPSPTESLLASGGESELSAMIIGACNFPTTDSRDDVGFLGSLPLSPRTKSKPVTPLSAATDGHGPPSLTPPVTGIIPVSPHRHAAVRALEAARGRAHVAGVGGGAVDPGSLHALAAP